MTANLQPVKPDRIVIFYDSHDSEWIVLRAVIFHYTIFKTDILDLLDIVDQEVPLWLEKLIKWAQGKEYRPIPTAPFPQSLPSLQTLLSVIPRIIEPGMSYPVFDGGQLAGIAMNPGGFPEMMEIPFKARLRDLTFKGLNFWVQGGLLNGAMCLVTQALLHYQKIDQTPALYPLLDISGFLQGVGLYGAVLWYSPNLHSNQSCYDDVVFAHNEISYYSGSGTYYVDRYFFTDCPLPDIPNGHFLRPSPGMKLQVVPTWTAGGVGRLKIMDNYEQGDNLDSVPFGCLPGWPNDSFLSSFGLYNDDSIGMNSLSTISKIPGSPCRKPDGIPLNVDPSQVVVIPEESEVEMGRTSFVSRLIPVGLWLVKDRCFKLEDSYGFGGLTIAGNPLPIAGFPVKI